MSRKERLLLVFFLAINLLVAYWFFDVEEWKRLTGSPPAPGSSNPVEAVTGLP